MTDHEVSAYLHNLGLEIKRSTLQQWRHTGGGPSYIKIKSKVRYTQESVDAWLNSFKLQKSTSEE
ncbi:AlpA family transcriptional regulator [Geobacter sp. AOG1]|uniref:helix-turn-helix transcriptional regulator n=1 Tax=Geobacter sp. AOG1 TaxID=1566346 RepID=UPI001CC3ABD6|nr:helix-turn-helix domain-containing protein [Geobacter sp. AOG1]